MQPPLISSQQAFELARSLHQVGCLSEAERIYLSVLQCDPTHAGANNELGRIRRESGKRDEAIALLERAVQERPDFAEALNNLGCAKIDRREHEEAICLLRKALVIRPNFPEAMLNLGKVLSDVGDVIEAIKITRRAIALRPSLAEAHWNLALSLLLVGSYEEGWKEYEHRPIDSLPLPRWSGESIHGQTLVVHCEQGIGDVIHFVRYLPMTCERSGARVVLGCPPALTRLLNGAGFEIMEHVPPSVCVHFGIPLLSLPFALNYHEPLGADEPYLRAQPALRGEWIARMGRQKGLRVGIVWTGNPANPHHAQRLIEPEHITPLLNTNDVTFYSLQIGQAAPEGVIDLTGHITDFADTAALMSELDLIITVDTAAAHLAGALGRPVWTLLPFVPDWRWGLEREDTPWYPTMRLFRQRTAGDWGEVIQRVAGELRAMAAGDQK